MADNNFILTPEGKENLEAELHYLETEKRAEIGERIKVAREFGDISENSEYDDAKNEQGMMEARIAEISRILSACKRNGCSFDMVLKDISSVGYDVQNLIRWEQIVMEMVRNY